MQDMAAEKRNLRALNEAQLSAYNEQGFLGLDAFVRGRHPDYPLFEGEPCKLPPIRSKMSRSIFQAQQGR